MNFLKFQLNFMGLLLNSRRIEFKLNFSRKLLRTTTGKFLQSVTKMTIVVKIVFKSEYNRQMTLRLAFNSNGKKPLHTEIKHFYLSWKMVGLDSSFFVSCCNNNTTAPLQLLTIKDRYNVSNDRPTFSFNCDTETFFWQIFLLLSAIVVTSVTSSSLQCVIGVVLSGNIILAVGCSCSLGCKREARDDDEREFPFSNQSASLRGLQQLLF